MYIGFIILAFASLTQLPGSACFKFFIKRDWGSGTDLAKEKWTLVEVIKSNDSLTVKFDIPGDLSDSDASIFFANDSKEILQVTLGKTVQGKYYSTPHSLVKEMKGEETIKDEHDGVWQVSASFPRTWLPEECNKVSAAIVFDGRYFNYYKLQNFKISLPDLMVVEEYMKIPDSIKSKKSKSGISIKRKITANLRR